MDVGAAALRRGVAPAFPLIILAGCGINTTVVSETCLTISHITYDRLEDTRETIQQIVELNAVLDALGCPETSNSWFPSFP